MKATYYAANYNALTIMAPFNSFDNQTFNKKSRKILFKKKKHKQTKRSKIIEKGTNEKIKAKPF